MSHARHLPARDSAEDLHQGWTPGAHPAGGRDHRDSLFGPESESGSGRAVLWHLHPEGPHVGPDGLSAHHLNFTLDRGAFGPPDDGSLLAGPFAGTGAPRPAPRAASGPPMPGDVVGGFRIVGELGRGAFARVYLAEQIDLGDRPVALKVSRAEGDEPQMLARLQHGHIVPIHSVYDDPETGLRLMCMPYLGGANLAQVIEEAATRDEGGPARRSLVAALDQVSRRFVIPPGTRRPLPHRPSSPSPRDVSGLAPSGAGVTTPREAVDAAEGPDPPGRPPFACDPSMRRASAARFPTLWSRLSGRRTAGAPARTPLDARDFDQPARQFLREANTAQAAAWVIARLAEGLEHAHSRGLLHRDLKPSNVLIASDGTPMLLDFNLSTSATPDDPAEGEKAMLGGTLPYMAPEHLDAFRPGGETLPHAVDERSDLYSLGLILFEMAAGFHPFPEPPQDLPLAESIRVMAEQRHTVPSLRRAQPGVPWGLDSIVRKCLDPDPARRYARARDLAEDLGRFLDDRPLRFAPDPSPRERLAKWARRNPRLCGNSSIAALSLALIVALGGLIGVLHGTMQTIKSRLELKVFHADASECQFLLNVSSGPPEHLRRGIALADAALARQSIGRDGAWRADAWPARLAPAEQAAVRRRTAELILLESRARVYLAGRVGTEADQRRALEWAVDWLNRAERLDPAPPAALFADRARYLAALGRADEAAKDRTREATRPPASARDFSLVGSAALARGDLARAEAALRRSVALDPRGFWAWFALGHCHYEQGRFADAVADFTACAVIEPGFAWPHLNRGLALARVGRLAEAREAYDAALAANPNFAEAWVNRAVADLERDDLPAAESAIERASRLGRLEPGVLAVWAEVKARRGDRAGAEKLFERLLRERPDDPMLLAARGVSRIKADPAGARADLRRAAGLRPGDARVRYGLALLLARDDSRSALAEADAALAADPDLIDAVQLRAVLRARLGDTSAVDDVDRIARAQSPHRLYNAACALALLVETAGEARLAPRALALLDRALDAGISPSHAAADPDLRALRTRPDFQSVLDKPRATAAGSHVKM